MIFNINLDGVKIVEMTARNLIVEMIVLIGGQEETILSERMAGEMIKETILETNQNGRNR